MFVAELDGEWSLGGLRAVVGGLSELQGRKSILDFTEKLPITDRMKPKFDALIGKLNRANITVYPWDASGLRVHSTDGEVKRNMDVAAAQALGDEPRDNGAWTKDLERQNDLLNSRVGAVLGASPRTRAGSSWRTPTTSPPGSRACSRSARRITCLRINRRTRNSMESSAGLP